MYQTLIMDGARLLRYLHNAGSHVNDLHMRRSRSDAVKVLILHETIQYRFPVESRVRCGNLSEDRVDVLW